MRYGRLRWSPSLSLLHTNNYTRIHHLCDMKTWDIWMLSHGYTCSNISYNLKDFDGMCWHGIAHAHLYRYTCEEYFYLCDMKALEYIISLLYIHACTGIIMHVKIYYVIWKTCDRGRHCIQEYISTYIDSILLRCTCIYHYHHHHLMSSFDVGMDGPVWQEPAR